MIKHIFKIIKNERRHNIGIVLELFLVAVFLWYIIDYSLVVINNYARPMGFDIEHTYVLNFGESEDNTKIKEENAPKIPLSETFEKITERIRHNAMIEEVSLSIFARPHIGNNSSINLFRDTLQSQVLQRMVTPDFFRVFRYQSVNGSTDELVEALKKGEYVISKSVEKSLFPDGSSAKGKQISTERTDSAQLYRVGAVSTDIRYDNFYDWGEAYYAQPIHPDYLNSFPLVFLSVIDICVRVKPKEDHDFIPRFREQLAEQLHINGLYLNTIQSIPVEKRLFQNDDMNKLKMRFFIISFLLVNIFLGITGTFWFRTQYRKNEMGVRIAMGETSNGILRMFYVEGLLLLTPAILPVMILFFSLKNAGILYWQHTFTAARYFIGFAITYLLLALMIILGIWFPARKAVKISPAEALRDE